MRKVSKEILEQMVNGTVAERTYIAEKEPLYFGLYYFTEYFTYPLAPFHFDFFDDTKKLFNKDVDEVLWIAFRESAKTSIAKMCVVRAICFNEKHYINWDSYSKENSESALFDIAVALQTNYKIINDFGHLYHAHRNQREQVYESKLKRINNFVTENGVKVEAFSTQESTRGRVYKEQRPDLFILDDIENSTTKESNAITQKIISHINEMKGGLSPQGSILYLGNLIIDDGIIGTLMENLKYSDRAIVRNIPVMDRNKKIAWPGKYVHTDKEASEINKTIEDKERRVVSLEAKRKSLGDRVFQTEMMNDPGQAGDYVFNRNRIRELLQFSTPEIREVSGLKIWEEYNPKHVYSAGADVAEGIGADHSASAVIDHSRRPAAVVATFKDDQLAPNLFAWSLKRHGEMFGEAYLVPELNQPGYAVVNELLNIGYPNVYIREVKNKTTSRMQKEYGFRMTAGNKWDIIGQFVSAVEDGDLVIFDEDLLNECYHYRKADLRQLKAEEGMTRHFDKLIAAALAWEGRKWVDYGIVDPDKFKSPLKKGEYEQ